MNPADILMLLRYLEQTFEPHQIDALVTYCEAHDFTLIQGLHRLAIESIAIDWEGKDKT